MAPPLDPQAIGASHATYYVYLFTALLAFTFVRYLYQTLASPLRDVPGPFLARFTRLWELRAVIKQDHPTFNIALHEQYGPVVRLGPNRYSINDPEAAKLILGHHNALDKSKFYYPFGQPDEYNMFSEPSIDVHAKIRRPLAQLYSQTSLLSYEPFVDTCNTILLKRLDEFAQSGKVLDVREMMQFYAFDVIGEMTCGSRFGLLEDDGDKSGIISAIDESMQYGGVVSLIPELHWWIGTITDALGIKPGFRRLMDFVNYHLSARVSGHTTCPPDRSDFLSKLLPLEESGKSTRYHTRQAAVQNIAAGSDTTAASLCALLAHLTMNPSTLAALRQELTQAKEAGTISEPVTFQQAQKLPYLQAVILEALRIHPAVGAPLARLVGPQGLQIAGRFVPPGTEVGVNAWVIHRNKSIYGPDADVFRPERWLTPNKEERAVLDRNFLAFGNGPRTCLGKNVSLLEMSKVVPAIVNNFDFQPVPNEKGETFSWETRLFAKPSFQARVAKKSGEGESK